MIVFAAVACVVLVAVVARLVPARSRGERLYSLACGAPLIISFVVPTPVAFAVDPQTERFRSVAHFLTWVGVGVSLVMILVGLLLTVRAAQRGDWASTGALACETAVAALPALVIGAYALVFNVL